MKDWMMGSLTLLVVWTIAGLSGNVHLRSHVGTPNYGQDACIDILLSQSDQKQQYQVYQFLRATLPDEERRIFIESRSNSLPFFRIGYVKVSAGPQQLNLEEISEMLKDQFSEVRMTLTQARA